MPYFKDDPTCEDLRDRSMATVCTRDMQELLDLFHETNRLLHDAHKELAQALADAEGFESRAIDAETTLEERYTLAEVDEKISEMQAEHESELDALTLEHESELEALTNPRRPLSAGWRPRPIVRPNLGAGEADSPSCRWLNDRLEAQGLARVHVVTTYGRTSA